MTDFSCLLFGERSLQRTRKAFSAGVLSCSFFSYLLCSLLTEILPSHKADEKNCRPRVSPLLGILNRKRGLVTTSPQHKYGNRTECQRAGIGNYWDGYQKEKLMVRKPISGSLVNEREIERFEERHSFTARLFGKYSRYYSHVIVVLR